MDNLRIELNSDGVRELLRSPEIMAACREQADRALGSLGDGYEVDEYTGPNRVNVQISAVSAEAKRENLENNTILMALGG